ncbi:hypothetical protein [Deinococcus peraridilitoris]|uniref:hypothetical protein n=1 Tax=Deinococcus peraridilitoris TaxID=432329 RepID=UPI00059C1167|nr:hypothetical protein [Deinococcus peraridilitoris]
MLDLRFRSLYPFALLGFLATACGTVPPAPANRSSLPDPGDLQLRVASSGNTYYVDCKNGNDANSGLSETQAWKSLAKANAAGLGPGSALLFKRGCTWDGQLRAGWTGEATLPVVISAYGSGSLPRIRTVGSQQIAVDVRGTHQLLEHLEAMVGNRTGSRRRALPKTGRRMAGRFHVSRQPQHGQVLHRQPFHRCYALCQRKYRQQGPAQHPQK